MGAPATGRRLAALMLAWLGGVAVQLQERSLQPVGLYLGLVAAGATALLAAWVWRRRDLRAWVLASAGAALGGFALTGAHASLRLDDALPAALEGRELAVAGVIASLPQVGANGIRFRFAIDEDSRRHELGMLPPRVALGWYGGFHEDAALSAPQRELKAGQRWRFTVRLRRPHGNLNPHGFDYELQLFEQGVRATGYVRDAPAPQLLGEGAGFPVERLRQRMRDAIYAAVPDRAAGVLAALAVGDQGAIEREDWERFRNTGVAHLMSISGLHVTMFAWLAGLVVGAGWRQSRRAMLALPAPSAARWGGLAAAGAYALFSGWGVPAQRTILMLAAVCLLQGMGLRWPWLLVLLAAAVVVTSLDPWALMQPGFWLSFVAVGLLLASSMARPASEADVDSHDAAAPSSRLYRLLGAARAGLRTQLVATLGLTPLTLVFFQQVSLVGLLANLVAIPVVTLGVTPLALLGAIASPLWSLGALAVQALDAFLALLASLPGAVQTVPAAPAWAQAAGLLAAALAILPLPWRARLLALPLALGLLLPPRLLPEEGRFDLLVADVGQGSAILVRTRGHVLLFDAGPQYSRDSDAGQRVLVPLLRARGDLPLDRLVLSHRDIDHVGGAKALLGALPVASLAGSLEPAHPLFAVPGPRTMRCEAGQRWTWDGVEFAVLRPAPEDYARALKPNALSCVIRVAGRERSLLLTGDIERDQEAALVVAHGGALRSDVLVVPHHGSKTSSSPAFLDAVRPAVAVVQAGYRNRFGHPAEEVLARYRDRDIAVVASPSCGAWLWPSTGEPLCQRERARRYWHWTDEKDEPPR